MPEQPSENGIVTIESRHSVDETLDRLKKALDTKGIALVAVVDHSGDAAKAGLQMPNAKLVIFGNPKAGTPLMIAAPTIAIDLPLKILIREDGSGKVLVSYNSAEFIGHRHGLAAEMMGPLAGVGSLAGSIAS